MNAPNQKKRDGIRVIGALKLATAMLLLAAGFGVFSLINKDLGHEIDHQIARFHLDPENRIVHYVSFHLAGIDRKHLAALGGGTILSALVETVEGVGLLLRRRWASYLTVVVTVLLIPLEIYELVHKLTAVRVIVLLVNLLVLAYLVFKLRREVAEPSGP